MRAQLVPHAAPAVAPTQLLDPQVKLLLGVVEIYCTTPRCINSEPFDLKDSFTAEHLDMPFRDVLRSLVTAMAIHNGWEIDEGAVVCAECAE